MKRRDKFDYILVETTGLADPAPVAQTFFVDEEVRTQLRLDAIVTVVDAKHLALHLFEEKEEGIENEALEQLAFADRVLVNKIDLVSEDELLLVEKQIRSINAGASIVRTQMSKVDLDWVLNAHAFELSRVLEVDPQFLEESEHMHDQSITSVGVEADGAVDLEKINDWLGWLLREKGTDIFRMKGIINVANSDNRFVFQGVHMLFDGQPDRAWKADEIRCNKMIFIGRNLDREELNSRFRACLVK
jgi:G3E family GTPase